MSKPFTCAIAVVLHNRFKEAAKVEGLTNSQCLEIALQCYEEGEIKLVQGTSKDRHPHKNVCFSLSESVAARVRGRAQRLSLPVNAFVTYLMIAALDNGLGAEIRSAA